MTTGIAVDRLDGGAVQVLPLDGARFGGEAVREPHRHDYHELIWVRAGLGRHLLDGRPFPVRPHTITVIGRGEVPTSRRRRTATACAESPCMRDFLPS
jgi:AraC family transcriptional activator of pobA